MTKLSKEITVELWNQLREHIKLTDREKTYGRGKWCATIEVEITKSVCRRLRGVAEVTRSQQSSLKGGFESYFQISGKRARLDGFFPEQQAVWEAKVSKVDTLCRKPGAFALHDLGQWAQDTVKLLHFHNELTTGLMSIILLRSDSADKNARSWFNEWKKKVVFQGIADLTGRQELLQEGANRRWQLFALLQLAALDFQQVEAIASSRECVFTFSVGDLPWGAETRKVIPFLNSDFSGA